MKPIRFPEAVLSALEKSKGLRIRAGAGTHRFIGIWFVVVQGRVVVRSWSIKPTGWYRKLVRDPRGAIQLGKSEIPIRAVPVKGRGLREAADRAYLKRYSTPGAVRYAKDLCQAKSKATTTELIPLSLED